MISKGLHSQKQPSKNINKETVQRAIPRNVQAIENAYEFFTKQRPISWQYYAKQITFPFWRTGTNFQDNEPFSHVIETLDVNEALVINHLSVSIAYRPVTDPTTPLTDIPPGYYNYLSGPILPTVYEEFLFLVDMKAVFNFNLLSATGALYESNAFANVGNNKSGFFGGFNTSERDGFTQINENVLNNAESSTALYIFEAGDISATFTTIDSYKTALSNFAFGFLPPDLVFPNGGVRVSPKIIFDIRGHKLNKNDAQLLKALIKSTPPS